MFKRLFGQGKESGKSGEAAFGDVCMPEVDEPQDIEDVFKNARAVASGVGLPIGRSGRHVIVVTPGRLLMFQPCPPEGTMAQGQVEPIERMIPSKVKRKIAAIAYTELNALRKDISKTIPFFGILIGFAYIGHAVWVFEGHKSALAAGCRDADVLIVDGAMIPHLQTDWAEVAASVMKRPEIYAHDRATYSLRKVT
ncbi:MAG TPA: hypothetical protein VF779_16185 [Pyrinomonadaceae bacterium]